MTPERLGPLWIGLAVTVVLALLVVVLGNVFAGGLVLGGGLLLAAAARGVAPEDRALGLKVRARWLDVLMYVALAAAVVAMAWSVNLL